MRHKLINSVIRAAILLFFRYFKTNSPKAASELLNKHETIKITLETINMKIKITDETKESFLNIRITNTRIETTTELPLLLVIICLKISLRM